MSELLKDVSALEVYLQNRSIRFSKGSDGALLVPIDVSRGVSMRAALRWARRPGLFECVTMLPIPLPPERRGVVASALSAANRTLPVSRFVAGAHAIFHVAGAELGEDGSLSSMAVDLAISDARVACQAHFKDLFRAALGGQAAVQTLGSVHLGDAQLADLRREAAAGRPRFAPRLRGPLIIDDVDNRWFREHRLVFVQSPTPMPALGIMACLTPAGRVRLLAGQVGTLNEIALAEGVALTGDDDALAYANLVTFWTRAADFPELAVASWNEIPFRDGLSAAAKGALDAQRAEVGGRLAPLAFTRSAEGWRLEVWLVSVSRLVHRTADLSPDGTLAVDDEVVLPALPVPPGSVWMSVAGRLVPVG